MAQTRSETPDDAGKNDKALLDRNPAEAKNSADAQSATDPIALLSADHRHVEQLFESFEKANSAGQKSQLVAEICDELMIHTLIEEEIFYPACQGHMERRLLDEAQVEHDGAKALIAELLAGSPDDPYFDAKVKILSEEIKHHVQEEEKPREGIFAKAKAGSIATPELAKRLQARKRQLMEAAKAGNLGPPQTRSFRVQPKAGMKRKLQENEMARSMTMERDSRGRFVSDDDDDRDYRRSRGRYYDDDYRRMPPRDEEGRFMSRDDDDDYRRSRGRGRYDEDDGRRMPPRDDEGRFMSSRSRYDDDDYRRGGRRPGGW